MWSSSELYQLRWLCSLCSNVPQWLQLNVFSCVRLLGGKSKIEKIHFSLKRVLGFLLLNRHGSIGLFSLVAEHREMASSCVYTCVCVYTHKVLSCLLFRFSVLKQVESTMYFVCVHWRTETRSNWERERKKGKKKTSKQKCLQWRRESITMTQTHRVSGINITEEKLAWKSTSFLKFFSGFFVWLVDF